MSVKDLHTAVIREILSETSTAKTYRIQPVGELQYLSGQFLSLVFPGTAKSGTEVRRAFSFSSSPGIDTLPAITIKRTENGLISRKIFDSFQVGDMLYYSHSGGQFTLPKHPGQLVFFAAGSGIVPIYSLLKTVLAFHPQVNATLIYSSRNPEETIFYRELLQLQQQQEEQLNIQWLFSNHQTQSNGRLSHFMLLEILKRLKQGKAQETWFYLCGPFDYMDMISIVLKTEGFSAEQIKSEHFFIPRSSTPPVPPDQSPQKIAFDIDGKTYAFDSEYPDSILTSALKQQLPLSYSCRSGQCGSCMAKCSEGKVWMRYNEVLTEKELEEGYVLTCCGFPVGGPVSLKK